MKIQDFFLYFFVSIIVNIMFFCNISTWKYIQTKQLQFNNVWIFREPVFLDDDFPWFVIFVFDTRGWFFIIEYMIKGFAIITTRYFYVYERFLLSFSLSIYHKIYSKIHTMLVLQYKTNLETWYIIRFSLCV